MSNEIVSYDKQWADQAVKATESERLSTGTFLSTRGGQLALGEEVLPGAQCAVIILDAVYENTFYAEKFDDQNPMPPVCYAFGRVGDEMSPHPSMQADLNYFQPQADTCKGCKLNEWGSADKGRGKACQERRRLTLMPAGFYTPRRGSKDMDLELFDDPKHYAAADAVFLKTPVTSVEAWAKYVHQIASTVHRPPHGVVTRIFLEPHAKYQYTVNFEMIEMVPDELAQIVMQRHEAATQMQIGGYLPPEEKAPPAQRGSLRGLRR